MSIQITANQKQALSIREEIALLKLPPKVQAQLMRKVGREVIKRSRANIRAQRTITGRAFAPRKERRKGQKKKCWPVWARA